MNHTRRAGQDRLRLLFRRGRMLWNQPGVRQLGQALRSALTALALAPAMAGTVWLPLGLGFLLTCPPDGNALAAALGGVLGAWVFLRDAVFLRAAVGSAAALLALGLLGSRSLRARIWFPPLLALVISGSMELVFLLTAPLLTPGELRSALLRALASAGSACAFYAEGETSSPYKKEICKGLICMGLAQFLLPGGLDLGLGAAALFTQISASLPGAVILGLAMDFSGITRAAITPILCLSLLSRKLSRGGNRLRGRLTGVLWAFPVLALTGVWDPVVPMSLFAGSLASLPFPESQPAQVPALPDPLPEGGARLEIAAAAMDYVGDMLAGAPPFSVDPGFLADRVVSRVCQTCPRNSLCSQQDGPLGALTQAAPFLTGRRILRASDLPEEVRRDCIRLREVAGAADQALEELRLRQSDALRRREIQTVLMGQYRLLGDYLRRAAGELDEPLPQREPRFRPELGITTSGKFGPEANGDRGAHFRGPGQRYYVLLCDGMGSGLGAAAESESALRLMTGMLRAGLPPEGAMQTLNGLYVLRETGGFSTADLLEIHLDTGRARLYKWGAAPSYLKVRSTARSLGSAAPPPGVGSEPDCRPEIIRLTLQRQEALILVSDGLASPELRERISALPQREAGAMARMILESAPQDRDDCTALVVILRPIS